MRPDWLTKTLFRAVFITGLLAGTGYLTAAGMTAGPQAGPESLAAIDGQYDGRIAVTKHGDTEKASLIVYGSDGTPIYFNNTYDRYFDVDPVSGTKSTLTFTAAQHVYGPPCDTDDDCSRNVIGQVNITTGETKVLFERYRPHVFEARWHDADRVGPHRWVIADIAFDRVMIVNTTTDATEYAWNAQSHFDLSRGKAYPDDWTHINDVEVLPNGQIMVSVRNQDAIVFLKPGKGVIENKTIGPYNHSILYEQHNPDYIPASNGGPAVIIADSQNDRIVEYEWTNGSWTQTWKWRDTRMGWPRDADRLPNGHTLITDSRGDRVLEVAPNGSILWSVTIETPYEAERLGTGDESTGGPAASTAGLRSRTLQTENGAATQSSGGPSLLLQLLITVRRVLPSTLVNGILYFVPAWMGAVELLTLAGTVGIAGVWGVAEYYWSSLSITITSPIRLQK